MYPVEFHYGHVRTSVRASLEVYYWIDQLLTVEDPLAVPPVSQFFDWGSRTILTGHLPWLELQFQRYGVPYVVYNREPFIDPGLPHPRILETAAQPGFTLKPFQLTTVRKMLCGVRGGVQLATGAGKTASYIAALRQLELLQGSATSLTLVTVTNLAEQMASRMKASGLDAALYNPKANHARHIVAVVNGVYRRLQNHDPDTLALLESRDVLCIDEGHHGQADTLYTVAMACPAKYRWLLSATLYANKHNPYTHPGDMRILGITGHTLAVIPAPFLWEQGYVCEPTITFIPIHWPDASRMYGYYSRMRWQDKAVWRGKGKDAATTGVEWDLIVNNRYRNEYWRRLVYWRLVANPDAKFVILVQRLDHGKILQRMLAAVGIRSACCFGGNQVVTLNKYLEPRAWKDHKDEVLKQFDTGELRVLVGSQKFDEGQSFPLFTDLILAQAGRGGEANRRVYQRVGRSFHSGIKVYVWDAYDCTHRMVQDQAEARLLALQNEGYPVRVDTPEECLWAIPGVNVEG